jgi:uncharacterized protein (DUF2126 family)/transglutaminase-like putative cysteine protease
MTIRVALRHTTTYRYDRRVKLGPQVVRLRPAPHSRTKIVNYAFHVAPKGHFLNWQQDPQGNFLARLVFPEPTDLFEVDVALAADMTTINPFDFFLEPTAERYPIKYDEGSLRELAPYLEIEKCGALVDAFVASQRGSGRRTIDFLVDLNQAVQQRVRYLIRMEPGVQAPDQTLELGSGSCRDSAWLLVQALRRLGLAARFASGYLIQLKADQKPIDGPAGPEADFTDLHAWAEVYLPGAGWVGLDATSGLFTGEGHIPLACTPEPGSAAPITGLVDECEVKFEHSMKVERILETPRVTLPYTDTVWQRIESLGRKVDRDLDSMRVGLTMGGEPTFVSLDDLDGGEWNFDALGPNKRRLAGTLFRRLANRFAKDPLLHFGQGKWYPGEQLPRWALGCYWLKSGEPFWNVPELVAEDERDYKVGPDEAKRFITRLAERLEVEAKLAMPAYEDPFHYLLTERRLPTNVTPLDNRLDDAQERARVARVFEQGLGAVVGYALPLAAAGGGRFRSGNWFLRRELLYLMPGDSPMGYRLPIDSLPWVLPGDYPHLIERDPFSEFPPPPIRRRIEPKFQRPAPASEESPRPFESAPGIVRTAICVEPREGVLHVFLPPQALLEDYVSLVSEVEATAQELNQPIRIEGYTPPADLRLEKFTVTPDPGVIEVNIHPSASFQELTAKTLTLYEEARECRLGTEKFMVDGRHTGTGGGNHVTLGGLTTPESPLLRRPDLLGSLVGYWHDHPSLSYLFSGLFIGPTSQAPRVDEARHEATYELETALAEARRSATLPGGVPPWLVDRIFRNLLADVTGNTHRSEFCIDKLYSPDSPTGRHGLLEMRAFEMPPHARMSVAQMLLVRALVSRFWKAPYTSSVVRWGTSLHDRFMLPHFVWQDFRDVLTELDQSGYGFEPAFFVPHFEFKFPVLGRVTVDGIELELRRALEPWHVLAEEGSAGGTARSVDSSLDRVQVMVRGAVPGRHLALCNGARVPLHPTGTQGESVAGVRFRTARLPSTLHPTVGVHAPLEFSLVDTWSERSIGGCSLAASHPGGRAYDTRPVNALEAEARRSALFVPFGHAPGRVDSSRVIDARNPDYPLTLDLRREAVGPARGGWLW